MEQTQANKNTQRSEDSKKSGKIFSGVVVSNKMKDTIVVEVSRYTKHPKYKKFIKRTKKYMTHDAGNTKENGDKVDIKEIRPLSKNKKFDLVASQE